MMFLLATDELVVAGRSYPGFPLLVDDDGGAIEPAQTFLWDHLSSGRRQNKHTWEKYGRALYDFFAYAYQNKLDWKAGRIRGVPSVVESYRDWSKGELDLDPSVINQRLGLIAKFYEWAVKHGLTTEIPFKLESVRTSRHPSFLAHVDTTGGRVQSPSIKLRQRKSEIKFLTKEQARVCLSQLDNETHRRMFELMVRTGLRQIECRTFPEKYIFDPSKRRDLVEGRMIRVHLDPRDMKTKYDKAREIDMPYALMEDLWWYSVRQRVKRERMQADGKTYSTLFLNEQGNPYGNQALAKIFDSLSARVGFKVTPHMLRHTYATYTLMSLRKSKTFEGEPLLYLRDRLGHSDIYSTAIYLHLINRLESQLIQQHEDELDDLFSERGESDGR